MFFFDHRENQYNHSLSADAQITYLELTVGGFGWVPNLTDVDHYLILPLLIGITNLAVIEVCNFLFQYMMIILR